MDLTISYRRPAVMSLQQWLHLYEQWTHQGKGWGVTSNEGYSYLLDPQFNIVFTCYVQNQNLSDLASRQGKRIVPEMNYLM